MRDAERVVVRFGIPALLLGSCAGAAAVALHAGKSEIPSFAFGSHVVLAVQISVLFFYGALLLLVPLVRALFDGALPVELSLRGARWKEGLSDLGDEFLVRQAKAEGQALQADVEAKDEISLLREEIEETDGCQEEIISQVLKRISALEKEFGSRRLQR